MTTNKHKCFLCFSLYNNPLQLQCRHSFCEECIIKRFITSTTCPNCSQTIPISEPFVIDMVIRNEMSRDGVKVIRDHKNNSEIHDIPFISIDNLYIRSQPQTVIYLPNNQYDYTIKEAMKKESKIIVVFPTLFNHLQYGNLGSLCIIENYNDNELMITLKGLRPFRLNEWSSNNNTLFKCSGDDIREIECDDDDDFIKKKTCYWEKVNKINNLMKDHEKNIDYHSLKKIYKKYGNPPTIPNIDSLITCTFLNAFCYYYIDILKLSKTSKYRLNLSAVIDVKLNWYLISYNNL